MAQVFFMSGLTKIASWENTVFLFEFEYQVPVLPLSLAAGFATTFELATPVLPVVGFMTRLAALPLLAMALVIQFALGAANLAFDNIAYYYWMTLLIVIAVRGPAPLSLDRFAWPRISGDRSARSSDF
jgi:putative oxidoreductase